MQCADEETDRTGCKDGRNTAQSLTAQGKTNHYLSSRSDMSTVSPDDVECPGTRDARGPKPEAGLLLEWDI